MNEPEGIMLSETSQKQKEKITAFLHVESKNDKYVEAE